MTLEELAAATNLSLGFVSKVERARRAEVGGRTLGPAAVGVLSGSITVPILDTDADPCRIGQVPGP
jgi:hypothetical protein